MSDAMSTYLENKIIDHTVRPGNPYTAPTNVYVALFTDVASLTELEAGDLTNEVTDTGSAYTRQPITFDTPVNGITQNSALIEFSQATAVWGNIRYGAVIDDSDAVTPAGNILYFGQLTADKQINTNDTFKFNIGDLDLTVQ